GVPRTDMWKVEHTFFGELYYGDNTPKPFALPLESRRKKGIRLKRKTVFKDKAKNSGGGISCGVRCRSFSFKSQSQYSNAIDLDYIYGLSFLKRSHFSVHSKAKTQTVNTYYFDEGRTKVEREKSKESKLSRSSLNIKEIIATKKKSQK
ncbi:MAG: hypothetical protein P1V97_30145, partial [Planctomycetota bacterium]|nr:hypothetical protein [Planctomycetota bacterium]